MCGGGGGGGGVKCSPTSPGPVLPQEVCRRTPTTHAGKPNDKIELFGLRCCFVKREREGWEGLTGWNGISGSSSISTDSVSKKSFKVCHHCSVPCVGSTSVTGGVVAGGVGSDKCHYNIYKHLLRVV